VNFLIYAPPGIALCVVGWTATRYADKPWREQPKWALTANAALLFIAVAWWLFMLIKMPGCC
jgi:hypothetical protein